MARTALIHLSKIKNPETFRDALKHNYRLINKETSIPSHIDSTRSHLNKVLIGERNPVEATRRWIQRIKAETGRNLRANGVFAIEVLISLPVVNSVPSDAFFAETLDWLQGYWACPIASAVVHADEANPHMHVLVIPLRNGRMIGSSLVGFKPDLATLKRKHHIAVGHRYGLTQTETVPRFRRLSAAKKIVSALQDHPNWLLQPSIETALLNTICIKPAELLAVLGIEPEWK